MSDIPVAPGSQAFAEQVRTRFRTGLAGAETLELELAEVVEHHASPKMECFSLFFRGPASPLLQQGIRRLEHAHLGVLELFLTPISLSPEGATYEAVFYRNRPDRSQPKP